MKFSLALAFAAALAAPAQVPRQNPPASGTEAVYRSAADSCARKLEHIRENGARTRPDPAPTILSEREVNAYFAAGRVQLPKGVRRVQFTGHPGVIDTVASIDFDQITANQPSISPIWRALFSGVHDVHVVAHAQGSGGRARIHTDSVDIDGVPVPRIALRYFIDKYVRPKYPNLGLDSTFTMPDRVDMATVGDHQVTLTQK
jgi:hypothetical protein